jgi:hypothetical protein
MPLFPLFHAISRTADTQGMLPRVTRHGARHSPAVRERPAALPALLSVLDMTGRRGAVRTMIFRFRITPIMDVHIHGTAHPDPDRV